jgi:hypothetical protein
MQSRPKRFCDDSGRKIKRKARVHAGFRGVTLKKNLCIFNAEKEPSHQRGKGGNLMYEIRWVREHIEVFLNGVFQFSADNMREVYEELDGSI